MCVHRENLVGMYSFLERLYGKYARRVAERMTQKYQSMMFCTYIRKYIKKHIKLRQSDPCEHPELMEYVTCYTTDCENTIAFLKTHGALLESALSSLYCENRVRCSNIYHPAYQTVREKIRDRIELQIFERLQVTDPYIADVLRKIIDMADDLRYGFVASENTAKTKIREHWVERPPPMCIFLLTIMFLRLVHLFFLEGEYETKDHLYILLTIMSLGSIYLVYLRVPQSICADAKKNAQEQYSVYKTDLHISLLSRVSQQTRDAYMEQEVNKHIACAEPPSTLTLAEV